MASVSAAQDLRPTVASAWRAYVAAAEARIAAGRGQAIPRRPGVERGEIVIEEVTRRDPMGTWTSRTPACITGAGPCSCPAPGSRTSCRASSGSRRTRGREIVVSSSILERRPGWLKVAIRVRRSLIISAVFDTEHEVRFERYGPSRASSWSTATKIAEVADAGTPRERPKRPDEDRGLLWRWNAYWRYEQLDQGVLVECESVTLSRTIPLLLRPVAGPIVGHVARESMDRTLSVFRERFRKNQ